MIGDGEHSDMESKERKGKSLGMLVSLVVLRLIGQLVTGQYVETYLIIVLDRPVCLEAVGRG